MKPNFYKRRVAATASCILFVAPLIACNKQVSGDVMATVDGRNIFRADVDKYYDNYQASLSQQPPLPSKPQPFAYRFCIR